VESLEAVEFIDSPPDLKAFGLAEPQAEVTVWTKEAEKESECAILVGSQDADKNRVVVKNPKFEYLFRVDAAFLDEFPKGVEDWQPLPPVKPEEDTDRPKETPKED
jgi:hypothetical protein